MMNARYCRARNDNARYDNARNDNARCDYARYEDMLLFRALLSLLLSNSSVAADSLADHLSIIIIIVIITNVIIMMEIVTIMMMIMAFRRMIRMTRISTQMMLLMIIIMTNHENDDNIDLISTDGSASDSFPLSSTLAPLPPFHHNLQSTSPLSLWSSWSNKSLSTSLPRPVIIVDYCGDPVQIVSWKTLLRLGTL